MALDEACENHVRVLTLLADIHRIDVGAAVLCTLLWYLDRHLLRHVTDWRIGVQYGYETGYRDGCIDAPAAQPTPELHLVEPVTAYANGHDARSRHH